VMSGTGEVANLQNLLAKATAQRDLPLQKELVKKVCQYMTAGVDVSPLFTSMIMASNTTDVTQKKLVYMYLSYYSRENADLALLSINTMHSDCRHNNPLIRGLALRSLSYLRVPSLIEYVVPMIVAGLKDDAPYVRKTAAVATAKLYRISPATVLESSIVDSLYDMIRDPDTLVIANAIQSLDEILKDEGGIATNKALLFYLLKKLSEFNEWHQIVVLQLIHRQYKPESDEILFQIMNMLDTYLSHTNHAVVFAVVALFLKFTESNYEVYQQVFQRVHDPLVSCLYRETEIVYETMKYIEIILDRSPNLFENDFKQFYGTHKDPEYLLELKFSLLSRIANSWSAPFIIDELAASTQEYSEKIAYVALQSISSITIKFPSVAEQSFACLLDLFTLQLPWLSARCLSVISDLLRKYPMEGIDVVTECRKTLEEVNKIEDTEGRNAAVWMLGEFGEQIATSPYVLEILVDQFEDLEDSTKMILLMSCVKLFGKRPAECQPILGDLLALCVEQTTDVHLRYRAMLYYKWLKFDIQKCLELVNVMKDPVDEFVESTRDTILSDQLFEEFHTLAVVYGKPCSYFPKVDPPRLYEDDSEEWEESESEETDDDDTSVTSNPIRVQYTNPPANEIQFLSREKATIDPTTFETCWQKWDISHQRKRKVLTTTGQSLLESLEAHLETAKIFVLASGETNGKIKIYGYSKVSSSQGLHYLLIELIADASTYEALITMKTDLAECLGAVLTALEVFLDRI